MADALKLQPVTELVVCEKIDLAALENIQNWLEQAPEGRQALGVFFDSSLDPEYIGSSAERPPIEEMRIIAAAVKANQIAVGGIIGQTQTHASLVKYDLYGWHADYIDSAYVVSPKVSPEGLRGGIAANDARPATIEEAIQAAEKIDSELAHVRTLEIIPQPPATLLHLPFGAPHRSPRRQLDSPEKRLLVNSVVVPHFVGFRQKL